MTSKKLIFAIHGGLGNQLFQYTAGLYAEKQWGIPVEFLSLAARENKEEHPRPYLLDRFCITHPVKRAGTLFRRSIYGAKLLPLKRAVQRACGVRVLKEITPHGRDPLMRAPPRHRKPLFFGFWQSTAYMEGLDPLLREEFAFKNPPEGFNRQMLERIQGDSCPVSLHIRRGDYATVPGGSIILPLSYYQRAIEKIQMSHSGVRFYVFSDDLNWAERNLPKQSPLVFVAGNAQTEADQDLRLIAACRHHIIANSSFSWWGAWLNPFCGKQVVFPPTWLTAEPAPKGLIPEGWTSL